MVIYLDNLLKNTLGLTGNRDLGIEQTLRALALKPNSTQAKPRSIVVKFGSYWTKEGILQRVLQKEV